MNIPLLIIHLIVCVLLIAVVLVQPSKGGLAQGAFGGATQTVFGGRGAGDFITRLTVGLAIVFFMTSLTLALLTARGGSQAEPSLIQEQARRQQQGTPAQLPPAQSAPGSAIPAGPASPGGPPPAPAGGTR